jgi:four helix bundle protein
MATIRRLEEIEAWQKARELTREIYEISKHGSFSKDFGLRDQIRRASVSVMSNIAEGYERNGSREFIQFLSMAKGSAGEVKSQLYVAFDQDYISKETFQRLHDLTNEITRMIGSLMKYLRTSGIRGSKYK